MFLLHKNSICSASETRVPSTIPLELDFINQFITRGKYIKSNNSIQEWSPSLHVGRIGFAPPQLYSQNPRTKKQMVFLPLWLKRGGPPYKNPPLAICTKRA